MDNLVQGQANLTAAIPRTLTYTSPDGRDYTLNDEIATLLVRPRGWHLHERHLRVDGEAMSGSLFDCGLFVFHNAQTLGERRLGPFFYLPRWKATSRHGCGTTSSP